MEPKTSQPFVLFRYWTLYSIFHQKFRLLPLLCISILLDRLTRVFQANLSIWDNLIWASCSNQLPSQNCYLWRTFRGLSWKRCGVHITQSFYRRLGLLFCNPRILFKYHLTVLQLFVYLIVLCLLDSRSCTSVEPILMNPTKRKKHLVQLVARS